MRCRLRLETCVREEPLPTLAETTAFTSPAALTPPLSWRIRLWMIFFRFTIYVFPAGNQGNTGSVLPDYGYLQAMGIAYPTPGARLIRALDACVALWLALWIALAVLVAQEVRDLRQLSDTVVVAGTAVEDTGELLDSLRSVPFVGGQVGDVAGQVRAAGRSAQASGRDSRSSVDDLSVLLALAIGLVPTLPLLALYAPLRIAWSRDSRAVRRALATGEPDPMLLELLARRALLSRSYAEIRAVTEEPFRDLDEGRFRPLAELELRRLGLECQGKGGSRVGSPSAPVR